LTLLKQVQINFHSTPDFFPLSDAPVFVYIHGGYWQLLGKSISAYCVKPLHNEGIISVIVGYDLAPNGTSYKKIQSFHFINALQNEMFIIFSGIS